MTPIGPRGSYAISAEEKKIKMIQKNKEHTFEAISDLQKESTRIAIQKKKKLSKISDGQKKLRF